MIQSLLFLLVALLFLFIVWYIVQLAAKFFNAPAEIVQILGLILLLIFLIIVLNSFGVVMLPLRH